MMSLKFQLAVTLTIALCSANLANVNALPSSKMAEKEIGTPVDVQDHLSLISQKMENRIYIGFFILCDRYGPENLPASRLFVAENTDFFEYGIAAGEEGDERCKRTLIRGSLFQEQPVSNHARIFGRVSGGIAGLYDFYEEWYDCRGSSSNQLKVSRTTFDPVKEEFVEKIVFSCNPSSNAITISYGINLR